MGSTRRSHLKIAARRLQLPVAALAIFFLGPTFLRPYYCVSGGSHLHDDTSKLHVPPKSIDDPYGQRTILLSSAMTAAVSSLSGYDLALALGFLTGGSPTFCPAGFKPTPEFIRTSLPANQTCSALEIRRPLRIIERGSAPNRDTDALGFLTTVQGFSIPSDKQYHVHTGLYIYSVYPSCNASHCSSWAETAANALGAAVKVDVDSSACTGALSAGEQACTAPIIVANATTCPNAGAKAFSVSQNDDNNPFCAFSSTWIAFRDPPPAYQNRHLWSNAGTLIGLGLELLMLMLSLYAGRRMHRNYLKFYYFEDNNFVIEAGASHDYKVFMFGEEFTSAEGQFELVARSGKVIFTERIRAEFPQEDFDETGVSRFTHRSQLQLAESYQSVQARVVWDREFRDADFRPPVVEMLMWRKIPYMVKSRKNVVLLPITFFLGLLHPRQKLQDFTRFNHYIFLFLYFSFLHTSWILLVSFFLSAYESHTESVSIWGTFTTRPEMSRDIFVVFACCTVATAVMPLLPFCRGIRRRVALTGGLERPDQDLGDRGTNRTVPLAVAHSSLLRLEYGGEGKANVAAEYRSLDEMKR